jgi:hypothetical protein
MQIQTENKNQIHKVGKEQKKRCTRAPTRVELLRHMQLDLELSLCWHRGFSFLFLACPLHLPLLVTQVDSTATSTCLSHVLTHNSLTHAEMHIANVKTTL